MNLFLCFSEKIYGTLFPAVSEMITMFFQRTHELQLKFLKLITENLHFDCMLEDELVLLIESKIF